MISFRKEDDDPYRGVSLNLTSIWLFGFAFALFFPFLKKLHFVV